MKYYTKPVSESILIQMEHILQASGEPIHWEGAPRRQYDYEFDETEF